jgi:hypothetical protein
MIRNGIAILACLALLAAGADSALATKGEPPALDAGLLVSRTTDLWSPDTERFRAAGPVVEKIHGPSGRTFTAFRPVAASMRDPDLNESVTHVLWPLFTSRRRGDERSWNSALIAWGRDADIKDPNSQWSLLVLPILALGKTEEGHNYGGVFPLAGRLQEVAGKDVIDFVLFPLYAYTRQGDLNTWNVLFPIISWTRAPDEGRFRVFPLYGQAHEPGIRRKFVLWPLWNQATYSAPQAEGYSWMLFPIAGRVSLSNQQTWRVLPPLFRYTRAGTMREWMAPWPFVQIKRGGPDEMTYLWPLYGVRKRPTITSRFVLWPIGRSETIREPRSVLSRRWVVPFYFDERRLVRPPGESERASERRIRLWPLVTYQKADDRMEWHTLELWPAAPVPAVERLYAPFWTLYSHERSGTDVSDELLWGLFRRQRGDGYAYTSVFPLVSWGASRDNGSLRWDVLKGLVGYEREGGVRRLRILYMRFK